MAEENWYAVAVTVVVVMGAAVMLEVLAAVVAVLASDIVNRAEGQIGPVNIWAPFQAACHPFGMMASSSSEVPVKGS